MGSKFYTAKKTIGGVEYTAQFNGISQMLKASDETQMVVDGVATTSSEKMANYVLENVLVEPKVTIDDFETLADFRALTDWLQDVMAGKFRPTENKGTTKK